MARNRLTLIIVVVLLLMLADASAWTATISSRRPLDQLAAALAGLDRERITTGILYDRVVPLSNIADHSGTAASPPVSLEHWEQMYFEMSRASLQEPAWPGLAALRQRAAAQMAAGAVPLAVMNFRYNRIHPDALDDGSLRIEAGRLVEGTGNPYEESRVFAGVALTDRTYRGGNLLFVLQRDGYVANDGVRPVEIRIDFGDGRDLRTVQFGERLGVRYTNTGRKTIRIEMSFVDGSVLQTALYYNVIALQAPLPHDTLAVNATIPYNSEYGSGEAYVYLSDSHQTLTNPAVVIEGFDLDNSMNWDELYALLNQEGLIESIRANGYDAVVLNFTEATDYIQKNGFVIVALIEQVLAAIDPQADIAIVGASMGGLASRYALAYMEANGMDHRVRTFISFDAPQNGANIPLGIQYWLDFFAGLSAEAEFLLSRLDTPAARQMLVYHHTNPPGATGESDPLRAGLISDLVAVGNYPANLRKVAVANGSGSQADQGFAAGTQIITYEFSNFLVDIVGNVWAVPDGGSQLIFDGLIDIILLPKEEMAVTVTGTLPYDNAPGGSRSSMADMDSTEAPYGDIVALYDNHCFIPTISALDLATGDLFYDIAGDPSLLDMSPFDAVYFPVENQPHVSINAENAVWFLSEIQPPVTAIGDDPPAFDPRMVVLHQNAPNPFNPTTMIQFDIAAPNDIRLGIYTVDGREVTTLVNGAMAAGTHRVTWDGHNHDGRPVASGIYFYRLRVGPRVETRKMIVIK